MIVTDTLPCTSCGSLMVEVDSTLVCVICRPRRAPLTHDAQGKPLYVATWNSRCEIHNTNVQDGGSCPRCLIDQPRGKVSMKVIGITGRKRHGKDSIGNYLERQFDYTPFAFAGALKDAAQVIFGLTQAQLYGTTEEKEAIDPRWGKSSREILQLLGTEVGRAIHPEVWVRSAFVRAEMFRHGRIVITDVRFPNEADAVRARGGMVIKVIRPGMDSSDTHASEAGVDAIVPDAVVMNDGTLEQLYERVDLVIWPWLAE